MNSRESPLRGNKIKKKKKKKSAICSSSGNCPQETCRLSEPGVSSRTAALFTLVRTHPQIVCTEPSSQQALNKVGSKPWNDLVPGRSTRQIRECGTCQDPNSTPNRCCNTTMQSCSIALSSTSLNLYGAGNYQFPWPSVHPLHGLDDIAVFNNRFKRQ